MVLVPGIIEVFHLVIMLRNAHAHNMEKNIFTFIKKVGEMNEFSIVNLFDRK